MYSSTHSFTSALDGGEWSALRPGRFTPREWAPGTHWIGGWVGPRAGLDAVEKRKILRLPPPRELNPRTPIVQPVAIRYTDWAITALICRGPRDKLQILCHESKRCAVILPHRTATQWQRWILLQTIGVPKTAQPRNKCLHLQWWWRWKRSHPMNMHRDTVAGNAHTHLYLMKV
jgi:hypothetical protein